MYGDEQQETGAANSMGVEDRTSRGGPFGAGLAIFLIAVAFFSGFHIGADARLESGLGALFARQIDEPVEDIDLREFWRVWNLLDEKFVAGTTTTVLTDTDRVRGAIDGLVDSYGDPYTMYMPPAETESFHESISGNFGGVGMEVGLRDGVVTVIAPLPGTPAEQAGLLSGDMIVKIDETDTNDMSIDQAVKLIRGESGTDVTLTIYREGELDFREITVTRAVIDIPTIDTELRDNVFIISLYSFNALAEMKMQEALREYTQSGASKLIIDLRGNPGGFLQSAVSISSYFLPIGKVVVTESFGAQVTREDVIYRSQGKTLRNFAPEEVVVLIDEGSASASEIVAGALRDHQVATLIGETSFGKGSVQELIDLPDGSSLKVTVARWLTPAGTSISEGGLTPDIVVERTPQMMMDDEDPQLEAAIAVLNGTYEASTSTPPVAGG